MLYNLYVTTVLRNTTCHWMWSVCWSLYVWSFIMSQFWHMVNFLPWNYLEFSSSLSVSPPPLSVRNVGTNQKHCLIQLTLLKMHSHSCWAHVKMVLFICLHTYNKPSTLQVFMKYSNGRFYKKCSDPLNKVWHKAEVLDTLNVHLYVFVCVFFFWVGGEGGHWRHM